MPYRRSMRALAGWLAAASIAVPAGASADGSVYPDDSVSWTREEGVAAPAVRSLERVGRPVEDVTVARPVAAVQLAAGVVAFVPFYLVAWPFGGGPDVLEACITEPWQQLAGRPLGEL